MSVFGSAGSPVATADGAGSDFCTRNLATTAGLAVGAGAVVAGAAILTAALPGQVVVAVGTTGALMYVGQRQADGKSIIPGRDNAAPAAVTPATVDAAV